MNGPLSVSQFYIGTTILVHTHHRSKTYIIVIIIAITGRRKRLAMTVVFFFLTFSIFSTGHEIAIEYRQ